MGTTTLTAYKKTTPGLRALRFGVHRVHAPASLLVVPLTVVRAAVVRACCVLNTHTHTHRGGRGDAALHIRASADALGH